MNTVESSRVEVTGQEFIRWSFFGILWDTINLIFLLILIMEKDYVRSKKYSLYSWFNLVTNSTISTSPTSSETSVRRIMLIIFLVWGLIPESLRTPSSIPFPSVKQCLIARSSEESGSSAKTIGRRSYSRKWKKYTTSKRTSFEYTIYLLATFINIKMKFTQVVLPFLYMLYF